MRKKLSISNCLQNDQSTATIIAFEKGRGKELEIKRTKGALLFSELAGQTRQFARKMQQIEGTAA